MHGKQIFCKEANIEFEVLYIADNLGIFPLELLHMYAHSHYKKKMPARVLTLWPLSLNSYSF